MLTALVPNVGHAAGGAHTITRIGRTANEIVHPSLLNGCHAGAAGR
ncbi:MAG: hypothetical protein R2749_05720 [Acidimicrobiales bacterium]